MGIGKYTTIFGYILHIFTKKKEKTEYFDKKKRNGRIFFHMECVKEDSHITLTY